MLDILRSRRSARKFRQEPVGAGDIQVLKEALLRSPTSRNNRPWEFIMVDSRELLKQLSRAKPHGASFLQDASLGIVILGDEEKSDVWVEDCSIAAITAQYAAESLKLGSCWIQLRNRDFDEVTTAEAYVQRLLGIPTRFRVLCILAVGHPVEQRSGVPFEKLEFARFHGNQFVSGEQHE